MRGNSALFSGLDLMKIRAGTPESMSSEATLTSETAVPITTDICMAAEEDTPAETAAATSSPPLPTDVGRRLEVYWRDEAKWFGGVLARIEAGHDDGGDAGDYQVMYDDGDEQWEPLGSRAPYRWVSERLARQSPPPPPSSSPGASSSSATSPCSPGHTTPPPRPACKRMLSEKSHFAALPQAKGATKHDDSDTEAGTADDVELS